MRRFAEYSEVAAGDLRPGSWPNGGADGQLVNGGVFSFANTRRNLMCLCPNLDEVLGSITLLLGTATWQQWSPKIDISNRINRPGKLNVKIWCSIISNIDANGMEVRVHCGDTVADFRLQGAGDTTDHWETLTLDLHEAGAGPQLFWIDYRVKYGGVQGCYLRSVEAYQPEQDGVSGDSWIDLGAANNRIGLPDYPDSGMLNYLMRNGVRLVHGCKVPRANVFCHWFGVNWKSYGSYGGANADLGRYYVVKRRGVSEVKLHVLATSWNGTGTWTLRGELDGAVQTTVINNAAALAWYTLTFTFAGADITNELEIELKLDGASVGVGTADMYLPGRYMIESSGAYLAHTIPDVEAVLGSTGIRAAQYEDLRDTLQHLWEYGGRQIILGDWVTRSATNEAHECKATAWDKTAFGPTDDVFARALAFHSTGSTRLSVRMGFVSGGTPSDVHNQGILLQLSESLVWNNWIDVDPGYEGFRVIGPYIDESDQWPGPSGLVIGCELEIDSGDWENEAVGPEPQQVWMQSITDNATEWLKPLWVSIEEIGLMPVEMS